ncbi:orotidine-5'-phosphate decarboxylase [Cumulibacter soli]|uniref:orotidine-5'-phosphate decarboxylase n=1 Tax=Cumulibacter soli TaxID=2546344 RepID=UPI001FB8A20F|nr:orotidine-5'-phosphate decarboxylase [Cumulibacter soli]
MSGAAIMTTGFGDRAVEAAQQRGPLCAGIDPHAQLLRDWGLPDTVEGLRTFALSAAEALAPVAAAVKPQSAFFERFGSAGVRVLEETITLCRDAGALVILDIKRGDIGSTAQAYADAYLRPTSPLFSDAVTVSPYLGFGSVRPFIDNALAAGSGVFVLARTSNPEGAAIQQALVDSERSVAQSIIDEAAVCNTAEIATGARLGSVGVVVGATVDRGAVQLSGLAGAVLAPGLGAQGASASDLREALSGAPLVFGSTSRDVLRAGPNPADLRRRARDVADELRAR